MPHFIGRVLKEEETQKICCNFLSRNAQFFFFFFFFNGCEAGGGNVEIKRVSGEKTKLESVSYPIVLGDGGIEYSNN